MNERIQKLAVEAEDYADGIVDQGGEFHETYTQKFAELIVRECANIAFDEYAATNGTDSGESAILKHFGVDK